MRRILTLAIVLLFTASLAWGADFGSLMSEGKAALASKDYSHAEKAFRSALAENPYSAEAELYLGITLSRKGDKSQYKEATSHLKRALAASPMDPVTNFELGMVFYRRAVPSEARDFFENVLEFAPGGELARMAQDQLRIMQEEGAAPGGTVSEARKRWALAFSTGVQYDSNVALKGHGSSLPDDIRQQYDWRSVYSFAGEYNFLKAGPATGSIGYSFYQNENAVLKEYDVQAQTARIGFGFEPSKLLKTALIGSYEFSTMGGDMFSETRSALASATINEGRGLSTEFDAKYSNESYYNVIVQQQNRGMSGEGWSGSISQAFPIGPLVKARLGFEYEDFDARADWESYDMCKGFAVLNASLPWKITVIGSGDFSARDYRFQREPTTGRHRREFESAYSVAVRRPILNWLSAEAGVTYVYNDSNVSFYTYDRTVTSVLLKARF